MGAGDHRWSLFAGWGSLLAFMIALYSLADMKSSRISCPLTWTSPSVGQAHERRWLAAPDGLRSAGDEYVQYAGVFERGVEGWRKEEARFVGEARVGSWIYQKDFIDDV